MIQKDVVLLTCVTVIMIAEMNTLASQVKMAYLIVLVFVKEFDVDLMLIVLLKIINLIVLAKKDSMEVLVIFPLVVDLKIYVQLTLIVQILKYADSMPLV